MLHMQKAPRPKGFRIPDLEKHNGPGDPKEHLQNYYTIMEISRVDNLVLCQGFNITVTKSAHGTAS